MRRAEGVTSISLAAWYGWKAEAPLPALRSAAKRSGLWVPVELALVPSPPWWGSCSSYTAINWKKERRRAGWESCCCEQRTDQSNQTLLYCHFFQFSFRGWRILFYFIFHWWVVICVCFLFVLSAQHFVTVCSINQVYYYYKWKLYLTHHIKHLLPPSHTDL